jgi:hypothetical protein
MDRVAAMKASPAIENFNGGELSPLMAGRVALKNWSVSCRKMRNFIPTIQGPARRRAGTRFVAEVKNSANRTWIGRFEFNDTQAYIIEFSDLTFRFFSNHGVVGAPFELAVPYTAADYTDSKGLFALRFAQSGDVLYIAHRKYPPQKLIRTGASTFTIAPVPFAGGPFKDVDPTTAIAVYSSANIGAGVTLTADAPLFAATDVGTLFLLEQKNVDAIKQWEPGKVIAINDVRRSDGKNYHALTAATTGSVRPTHSVGARYDGDNGVQWQFDDPGYGWLLITGFTSTTVVTATVISRIPDGAVLVANKSTRWAKASWSSVEGYPDEVCFFRERLLWARDRLVWGSVSADFENMRDRDDGGLVVADASFRADITSDRGQKIIWMSPSDRALIIGTDADEHAMAENNTSDPFGPGNIAVRKQSEYGSRRVRVVKIGEGVIYAQKSGRKLLDIKTAESVNERWVSANLNVLADHVLSTGIIDMAYQQEPDSVVWAVRGDGQLVGFTMNREQEVRGWHPHRVGGYANSSKTQFAVVESIAVIPAPAGDRDELWMVVRRTINGITKRYVEWMEYQLLYDDNPIVSSFYVDSGLTLNNTRAANMAPAAGATVDNTVDVTFDASAAVFSAPDVGRYIHYSWSSTDVQGNVTWHLAVAKITSYVSTTRVLANILSPWPNLDVILSGNWRVTVTTVSGLDHLEGQTVDILADGAPHPQKVVVGGSVTLNAPASYVHVGLPCPASIQPMPIEAGAADGTSQGKTKRLPKLVFRFDRTAAVKYGRDEDSQMDEVPMRSDADDMDQPPPLFTGDRLLSWPDGYQGDGKVTVLADKPMPATLVAIFPQITTEDSR